MYLTLKKLIILELLLQAFHLTMWYVIVILVVEGVLYNIQEGI